MLSQCLETKKAAGRAATTATTTRQELSYRPTAPASRANLSQAADILCLVTFFRLSESARMILFALFEQRLGRAYKGGDRC